MITLDRDGCLDLEKCEYRDLRDFYAARILEKFVERGGQGLRSELLEAMEVAMEWYKLRNAKKDR